MNVLLITLDQFRGDCLSLAGHPVVRTPNLDRLASSGTWLSRHYSQAAPCSPGRACLYTGTYQFNNRVVGNGTPLDDRLDNVARAGPLGKGGFFEPSYHVVGIVRDPRHPEAHGRAIDAFTENIDILPTLCEAMGILVPAQCDGMPLTPFLAGDEPPWWRDAAHWEYDWRWEKILFGPHVWPWTGAWNDRTWPCSVPIRSAMSSSATGSGAASTWPPIRPGAPRSTTRRSSCSPPSRCWRGGPHTPTGCSATCCSSTGASVGSRLPLPRQPGPRRLLRG